ncbi:MAG: ABC transporter permease subunit [Bryobacteraceae bacterium]|nr:ABC transporter permease subunit [Bryobacteraceae bacterium]
MKGAWLAAPAVLVIALLFVGGLILALAGSLPLSNYESVLRGSEFQSSLVLTVWIAAVSTLFSAVLGLLAALAFRHTAPRLSAMVLQVVVVVPHLAFAVAAIHLLAPSGLIARVLLAAGLLPSQGAFPELLYDGWGIGIISVYVVKETPFLALLCLTVLLRLDRGLEEAARLLGASRLQTLLHVTLPLVAPTLGAGSAVVFAFVFSAFEVPWLVGRTYPAMLGVVAQKRFMEGELADRPEALAVAVLGALVAIVVTAAGTALAGRRNAAV